jgi:hypothetical protein
MLYAVCRIPYAVSCGAALLRDDPFVLFDPKRNQKIFSFTLSLLPFNQQRRLGQPLQRTLQLVVPKVLQACFIERLRA